MAKKYRPKVKGYDAGQAVTTKSPYGSHADMVVDGVICIGTRWRVIEDHETVCKDDRGYYITTKARLDNGLADPNRYAGQRNE